LVFVPLVVDDGSVDVDVASLHAPRATPAARPGTSGSTASGSPTRKSAPSAGFTRLLWPVPGGYLSQGFGCTGVIWEPAFGSCPHYHNGIDIAAHQGTPILAAAGGTVVFAGWRSNGGGYQVWVSDGANMFTGYHHMASVAVYAGERIGRGQRIGAVGMTGNATGPHCHFMVSIGPFWAGGRPVDPRRYL
jgi:murein DD-endopeptidase MepM/ murein hydrolase activator NlpD